MIARRDLLVEACHCSSGKSRLKAPLAAVERRVSGSFIEFWIFLTDRCNLMLSVSCFAQHLQRKLRELEVERLTALDMVRTCNLQLTFPPHMGGHTYCSPQCI